MHKGNNPSVSHSSEGEMDDLSQILKIAGTSPSPVNSASLNWLPGLSCLLASHPPPQDWPPPCTGYWGRGVPQCLPLGISLSPGALRGLCPLESFTFVIQLLGACLDSFIFSWAWLWGHSGYICTEGGSARAGVGFFPAPWQNLIP